MVVGLCSAGCKPGAGAEREKVAPPARHAISSRQLQDVMQHMGSQVGRNWPQEIAEERVASAQRDRRLRFRRAAELSGVLAESAKLIPEAAPAEELTPAERTVFMARVKDLEQEAGELRDAARKQDADRMERLLARIQGTCMACHDQFAELAGPIRFGLD
jgi:hypothetical protein